MPDVRMEAAKLFAREDELQAELRNVKIRLRTLRGAYMSEKRMWGMDDVKFRKEVGSAN